MHIAFFVGLCDEDIWINLRVEGSTCVSPRAEVDLKLVVTASKLSHLPGGFGHCESGLEWGVVSL